MIVDNSQIFSDHQAITATAASTNILDLGASPRPKGWVADYVRDKGEGKPIPIAVQVTQDFNTLTSLTVSLEMSDTEAFTVATTVASTGAIPLADLKAGKALPALQRLPLGITQRYIRLKYTVAGTSPTTGKVFAGVVMDTAT